MKIEHRVSLVGQITDNLCWLAAFQMLEGWYNHRLPKRPTAFTPTQLAHLKTLNWGVQPHAVGGFATLMGLTIKIAPPTLAGVGDLLKTYGPLWYPGKNTGYLPVGTHHVVVLRGLAGTDLSINDPSPVGKGSLRTLPATTFFQQLQPLGNQFLVMLAGSVPNTAAILNDLKVR
jgi:hypothetical protein